MTPTESTCAQTDAPQSAPTMAGSVSTRAQDRSWFARWTPPATSAVALAAITAVIVWQLHPGLLFANTSTAGGDTGSHYIMPAYMGHFFPRFSGWSPEWFDGYPMYTFYFVLPDALISLASHLIAYNVAFKLGTVLGSLLMTPAAFVCGRALRLPRPVPEAMAAAMLPFLFDYTWTIYGGNIFSTLAGEYSYSLSAALLVAFIGLFARGLRTGRHRTLTAVMLAACMLAHVVPGILAALAAVVLMGLELLPARFALRDTADRPHPRTAPLPGAGPATPDAPGSPRTVKHALWWGISTSALGALLSAWWWVPFVLRLRYSTDMGYSKVTTYTASLFPHADWWVLALALAGAVVAVVRRRRAGVVFAVLAAISAALVVLDPSPSIYNVRFLPLWFLFVYLLAGWTVGTVLGAVARKVAEDPHRATTRSRSSRLGLQVKSPTHRPAWRVPWSAGAVGAVLFALAGALLVVVPPFVPGFATTLTALHIHPGANEVSNWAAWDYSGYSAKGDYPEFHGLMELMAHLGTKFGCGRAMWEYNADENRFGTPEALMDLPFFTHGCIDSMEGLVAESSATAPFHYLNQAELSAAPSDPIGGLPYGGLTVTLGVRHLQLLGVRYFMAASPQVVAQAERDRTLRLVATSGPWRTTYTGASLSTTWKVFLVAGSSVVEPLANTPAVLSGVGTTQSQWLLSHKATPRASGTKRAVDGPALAWYLDPTDLSTELVQGGPPTWPRIAASRATHPPARAEPRDHATGVRQGADSISFAVSRVGVPVLVKISYFPNWHATGALGPYRATPNLMVVVPTSHHVTISYGTTWATDAGDLLTLAGVVAAVLVAARELRRRRRRAPAQRPA